MANKPLRPGSSVPISGIYREVGPRGGDQCRRVTSVKSEPLPPTTKAGNGYVLDKATKRKDC